MWFPNLFWGSTPTPVHRKETKKKTEREKRIVSVAPDKKCLSEMGNKFTSLVANNFDMKLITYTDALSYLSIK